MSPRDWSFRLLDIQSAAQRIKSYVHDRTWESFEQDFRTQDAVIRQLTVLGEAATHVPPEVMELAPEVPWNAWNPTHKPPPPLAMLLNMTRLPGDNGPIFGALITVVTGGRAGV